MRGCGEYCGSHYFRPLRTPSGTSEFVPVHGLTYSGFLILRQAWGRIRGWLASGPEEAPTRARRPSSVPATWSLLTSLICNSDGPHEVEFDPKCALLPIM